MQTFTQSCRYRYIDSLYWKQSPTASYDTYIPGRDENNGKIFKQNIFTPLMHPGNKTDCGKNGFFYNFGYYFPNIGLNICGHGYAM